jgi:Spy/CpxP family protein refolding chaperone
MMKNYIAIALLSVVMSVPAFAADAAKAPAKKPAAAAQQDKAKEKDGDDCHGRHGHGMEHGGYGMGMGYGGYGMGGHAGLSALNLTKDQQDKVTKLTDDLKHNNWTNQGLINDESAKLRDLYEADKRDPDAIDKEYQKIFDIKRQMIRDYLTTHNSIQEILTPEQQAKMKEMRGAMHGMGGEH